MIKRETETKKGRMRETKKSVKIKKYVGIEEGLGKKEWRWGKLEGKHKARKKSTDLN